MIWKDCRVMRKVAVPAFFSAMLEPGVWSILTWRLRQCSRTLWLSHGACRFVGKVLTFLTGLLSQLVGEALADAGGGTQAGGRYDSEYAPRLLSTTDNTVLGWLCVYILYYWRAVWTVPQLL